MANKRRPQKYQVPYIRYGKDGAVKTKFSKAESKKKKNSSYGGPSYDSSDYYYDKSAAHDDEKDLFYTYSYGEKKDGSSKIDYYKEADIGNTANQTDDLNVKENKKKEPVKQQILPNEVIEIILKSLSVPDGIHLKFFLVSKLFFKLCLQLLYTKPILNSLNFNKFVDTMTTPTVASYITYQMTERYFNEYKCSGNNHISISSIKRNLKYAKTPLVRALDLSNIVQAGRNSNITKILRRCSINLEEIVAPQCSFGLTCLNITKQCSQLVILDLSLVSETVNLIDLFNSIKELSNLKVLKFPRSSINCDLSNNNDFSESSCHELSFRWPINLHHLKLSGGITNEFIMDLNFPNTLRTLEFQYCPLINDYSIYYLLSKLGRCLKSLSILYPMPNLKENSLDMIFRYCPFLESSQIFVDYISQWCFNEVNFPWIINTKYIPGYKQKPYKEDVLLEGENLRKPYYSEMGSRTHKFKYKLSEDEMNERDIIVATTTNYFENEEVDEEEEIGPVLHHNASSIQVNDEITRIHNNPDESYTVTTSRRASEASLSQSENNDKPRMYPGLESLRPLKALYLGSSGTLGQANKVHPDDLIIALGENRLPNLKSLYVSNRVGWGTGNDSMSQLVDLFSDANDGNIFMCP